MMAQQRPTENPGQASALTARTANCGALALAALLAVHGRGEAAAQVSRIFPQTPRGFNLHELQALAAQYNLRLTPVKVDHDDLSSLPLPAITPKLPDAANATGHFAILLRLEADHLHLFDPQSNRDLHGIVRPVQAAMERYFPRAGHGRPQRRPRLCPDQRFYGGPILLIHTGGNAGIYY